MCTAGQWEENVHMSFGVGNGMIPRILAWVAFLGVEACLPNTRDCDC